MNPTMVDIFSDDAFGLTSFTKALDKIPYKPQLLGQLGLFTPDPIDTVTFAIESREGALSIIKSSPRGAPLEQLAPESRDVRDFRTIRLAKGDKIMASELLGRREFGSSVDMERVMTRVMRATTRLRNDMEMTWERHRLGALQGIVLDANDSPLYNWFTAWGVAQPAEINFDLANADTDLRKTCRDVKRTMQRNAEGAWVPGTSVGALVGDNFYDALVNHKVFKEAKLGTDRAPLLENIEGFSSVEFEGITFINYRGTDDGTTLSIGTDKAKFFPIGANDVFRHVMSPGESLADVGEEGKPLYPLTIPDRDRDAFVKVELYSYPSFVCTRPKMLLRGKRA